MVTKRVTCSWKECFVALERFRAREGHCNVPRDKVDGAIKLGRWARAQRTNQDKLSANRRRPLDAIGFIWNLRDSAWEEGYSRLLQFRGREGHSCAPQHHIEGAFRLGQWVNLQRTRQKKLHTERKRRLDSVGFVWDPRQTFWEDMFARLKDYKIKNGDCNVSSNHADKLLACWVRHQRSKKYRLSEDRRDRLSRLGFVWIPFHEAWQRGFSGLKKFKSREDHCRVPEAHIEGTYNLGAWVKEQRRKKNSMAASRRQQLDVIGFWRQSISVGRSISHFELTDYGKETARAPLEKYLKAKLISVGYPWPDHLEAKSITWLEAEIKAITPRRDVADVFNRYASPARRNSKPKQGRK